MLEVLESLHVKGDLVGDLDLGVRVQVFDESLRPEPRISLDLLDVRFLFHLGAGNAGPIRMFARFAVLSSREARERRL